MSGETGPRFTRGGLFRRRNRKARFAPATPVWANT